MTTVLDGAGFDSVLKIPTKRNFLLEKYYRLVYVGAILLVEKIEPSNRVRTETKKKSSHLDKKNSNTFLVSLKT